MTNKKYNDKNQTRLERNHPNQIHLEQTHPKQANPKQADPEHTTPKQSHPKRTKQARPKQAHPQHIHPIDVYAGAQLRQARKSLNMTQTALAKTLSNPTSFQQVQKYEKGANRLSASTLWEFCQALNLPPDAFFPPFPQGGNRPSAARIWAFSQTSGLPTDTFFPAFPRQKNSANNSPAKNHHGQNRQNPTNSHAKCANMQEVDLLKRFRTLPKDKKKALMHFLQSDRP